MIKGKKKVLLIAGLVLGLGFFTSHANRLSRHSTLTRAVEMPHCGSHSDASAGTNHGASS
jgi:hypothetical protein